MIVSLRPTLNKVLHVTKKDNRGLFKNMRKVTLTLSMILFAMSASASSILSPPELDLNRFEDGTIFGIVYGLWRAQKVHPYDQYLCMPDDLNEIVADVKDLLAEAAMDDTRVERNLSYWTYYFLHKHYECDG